VSVLQGSNPKNGVLISVLLSQLIENTSKYNKTTLSTFRFHIFIYSTCNHFAQWKQQRMSGENVVRSKNAKLKCREFSRLQKREIKMQQKIKVFYSISHISEATALWRCISFLLIIIIILLLLLLLLLNREARVNDYRFCIKLDMF